ncbi:transcription factor bHLH66-like [Senna tora]|uniref:Transcription factor bHLH66-like n=1 Tax=Senna tora TaxID=362788 RepID=A0A834XB59_9FABA|nr:transcription factor bHLH66-like [Senna tora]
MATRKRQGSEKAMEIRKSMSVLTIQSTTVGNDGAVKDAASVSKP